MLEVVGERVGGWCGRDTSSSLRQAVRARKRQQHDVYAKLDADIAVSATILMRDTCFISDTRLLSNTHLLSDTRLLSNIRLLSDTRVISDTGVMRETCLSEEFIHESDVDSSSCSCPSPEFNYGGTMSLFFYFFSIIRNFNTKFVPLAVKF